MSGKRYDVVILGAGPAGTVAALRLRQLGYQVKILEKAKFPRFNIGESLSPGVRGILSYLEAEDVLCSSYLYQLPTQILWDNTTPLKSPGTANQHIIVDRAIFDESLLAYCIKKEVSAEEQVNAVKMAFRDPSQYWDISFKVNGVKKCIEADTVFDARGRLGTSSVNRFAVGPTTVATWGILETPAKVTHTFLEACSQFWAWGSPLPSGNFRIILFSDPELHKQGTDISERISNLSLSEEWGDFKFRSQKSCSIQPYWNTRAIGKQFYAIGETAFALDPLSSSGVEKAMRYALQAVIAFHDTNQKNEPKLANKFLTDKLLSTMANHVLMNRDFYSKANGSYQSDFWKNRRCIYTAKKWKHTNEGKLFSEYLTEAEDFTTKSGTHFSSEGFMLRDEKMQLGLKTSFQNSICVENDCLVEKEAIHNPYLNKPIAYLGGIEIVPLLKMLPPTFSLTDLAVYWKDHLSHTEFRKITNFLLIRRIFETTELTN